MPKSYTRITIMSTTGITLPNISKFTSEYFHKDHTTKKGKKGTNLLYVFRFKEALRSTSAYTGPHCKFERKKFLPLVFHRGSTF